MSDAKEKRPQQVFTLLVEVGRKPGDGLPDGSTGAALMIYASGVDEAEAVRETVAILKQADLAPLDVSGYGTLDERLAEGHDINADERALMDRALAENSVIVAQMTPFFEDGHNPDTDPDAAPAGDQNATGDKAPSARKQPPAQKARAKKAPSNKAQP